MAERGGSGTRDDERRVHAPAGPAVARGAFSVRDVRGDVRALRVLGLGGRDETIGPLRSGRHR